MSIKYNPTIVYNYVKSLEDKFWNNASLDKDTDIWEYLDWYVSYLQHFIK